MAADNSAPPGAGELETQGVASYLVDLEIYGPEALFRACYQYTDRCYLFLTQPSPSKVLVEFRLRPQSQGLADIVGSFANELINQRLRVDLARETQAIRERIVAEAFGEARFADGST
jgi:His-Xaa-Ser system protein HxsD